MYWAFTAAFAYEASLLPTAYLYFVAHMRTPIAIPAPTMLRVALITLCVPDKESIEIVERQLQALTQVRYPHDSWVLDEGNSAAIRAVAARYGVRYFTRGGIARYNERTPPFKAKTKAGNVNAWLDGHGKDYDFFVQFDIDHRPLPAYLDRVLGYFQDPGVAWVQAPSLYGNLDNWVARGAAEQELVLQGPLQQGFYGSTEAPFIIGSHTTYRMSAILEIGGFQATRAEDHLDSLVLAERGYRGVFLPEKIAVGSGPETFDTYLRQQFAWSMSLMEILFRYAPRAIWHLTFNEAIEFLFAETWYPFWSTSLMVMFSVPALALLTQLRPANVGLLEFAAYWAPMGIVSSVAWLWTRRWQFPKGLHLSWRGVILHIARWPIVFLALANVVLHIPHSYMITRKGLQNPTRLSSLKSQWVYILGVWSTVAVIWWFFTHDYWLSGRLTQGQEHWDVLGFTGLALWGSMFFLFVLVVNAATNMRRIRRANHPPLRMLVLGGVQVLLLVATVGAWSITANESLARIDDVYGLHLWPGKSILLGAASASGDQALVSTTAHPDSLVLPPLPTTPAPPTVTAPIPTPTDVIASVPTPPVPAPTPTPTPLAPPRPLDLPANRIAVGAFDPAGALANFPLDSRLWFIRQDQSDALATILDLARDKFTPLVTIEPWPVGGDKAPVLDSVAMGMRDDEITRLAVIVAAQKPQIVLVRWAQEMDLSGLYPWSSNDPQMYQGAYRRVVWLFRQQGATNVRWVWSPAGKTGAEAYYPGDGVDYIGLTILGDEQWDHVLLNLPAQSFAQLLQPKYDLVARFGKPILIPELGVSGTNQRKRDWLLTAAHDVRGFPLVRGVSYYDDSNVPNALMPTAPDWRVPPDTMQQFVAAMTSK